MKTSVIRLTLCVLAVLTSVTLTGCQGAAPAAVTSTDVGYVQGDLAGAVPADPPSVVNAAQQTLEDMNMLGISVNATSADGKVLATTPNDRKVVIDVQGVGPNVSKIGIRVGVFGNEEVSRQILGGIEQRLGMASATPRNR